MTGGRWRTAELVALRLVITLLFVPAILVKFRNPAAWAQLFTTWGYPAWGPLVISTIEVVALAALWIPALTTPAGLALMATTAGAAGTWLIHGPRSTAAYPGTIFLLVALLAWLQRLTVRR